MMMLLCVAVAVVGVGCMLYFVVCIARCLFVVCCRVLLVMCCVLLGACLLLVGVACC